MISRIAPAAVAFVVLVGALAGCATTSPEPEPTPSSAFADEAAAFAAAEETYRAYVDALNARREDPNAQPAPQAFLIDDALEVDRETQDQLDQAGIRVVGQSIVVDAIPMSASPDHSSIALRVCLDSEQTRVLDTNGSDVTPDDREARSPIDVTFRLVDSMYLIAATTSEAAKGC